MKKAVIVLIAFVMVASMQVSADELFSTPCGVKLNNTDNIVQGSFMVSATPEGISMKIKGVGLSSETIIPTDKIEDMISALKKAHKWTDIISKAGKNVAPKTMYELTKPQNFGDPAGVNFAFFAIDHGNKCGVIVTIVGDKNNFIKLTSGLSINDIDEIVKVLENKAASAIKEQQDAVDAGDLLN